MPTNAHNVLVIEMKDRFTANVTTNIPKWITALEKAGYTLIGSSGGNRSYLVPGIDIIRVEKFIQVDQLVHPTFTNLSAPTDSE